MTPSPTVESSTTEEGVCYSRSFACSFSCPSTGVKVQENIDVGFDGVDLLRLFFQLGSFIIKPLLLVL
jgi:hypothetical protein